ncbi:hypothetical protein TNCV_859111 [Trichonephila clavipes]|nr:hypothetical protein TNCV_859111 [Trichonephila clavipes]
MEQSTLLSVDLWSGREKKKRETGMARKRAENREGSLGFPGKEAEQKERNTTLGEIALISCPIPNCPHHTLEKIQSLTGVTNLGTKNNEKAIEQNSNPKNNNKEDNKNPKIHKRTGQEDFKATTKFARKCIEIPIEKVSFARPQINSRSSKTRK